MRTALTHGLNEDQVRAAYHRKHLRRHHSDCAAVVVDELGLQHGRFRADIAVVNGHLAGYEIKSDFDRLDRLSSQIGGYGAVFDRITLIVTSKHLDEAVELVPDWWGVVSTRQGPRGGIHFATVRTASRNPEVDNFCVAQLLWRREAREALLDLGVEERQLNGNRATLYGLLVRRLSSRALREVVREKLKSRSDWRRL